MSDKKCEHPDRRPADGNCGPALVKQCHGEPDCEHPERRPADGNCSPDLKKKCHGC